MRSNNFLALCLFGLTLATAVQARVSSTELANRISDLEAADQDAGPQLVVDGLLAEDLSANALVTVLGVNLDNGALPLVTLGGISLSNVVVAMDGLSLSATLPQDFSLGSYNLTVQTGPARTQFDAAMLSFAVTGPAGEPGATGPAGPRGPAESDNQTLSLTGATLGIDNGNAVDLSGISSDEDSANELNTDVNFDGMNLSVTDAGGSLSADLSSLSNSPAQVLGKLKIVDGPGSALDADTVDGVQGADLDARLTMLEGADQDAAGGQLIIQDIDLSGRAAGSSLLIQGVNFDNGALPVVTLGGIELVNVVHSAGAISATLVADANTELGYSVTVRTGDQRSQFDTAMIGSEIQGPRGERGPQGEPGSQGPDVPDDQLLSLDASSLSIENGNAVDLAALFHDTDAANELNTGLDFDGSTVSLSDADGSLSADISTLNDDAAEILVKLQDVAGMGSGLDADQLDGQQASDLIAAGTDENRVEISAIPYGITEPGSYVLTQDLVLPVEQAGSDGITIAASYVSLDLNGFALLGSDATFSTPNTNANPIGQGGRGGDDGIAISGDRAGLQVFNGTIANWGGKGVAGFGGRDVIYQRLRIINNGDIGLRGGIGAVISEVTAFFNGGSGIHSDHASVITDSTAQQNGDNGIQTATGGTVSRSSAYNNFGDGVDVGQGSTVTSVSARDNRVFGFDLAKGSTIERSSAYDNGCHGIDAITAGLVRGNVVTNNGNSTADTCEDSDGDETFGPGHGIRAGTDTQVINNLATNNFGSGIHLNGTGCLADGNLVTDNDLFGIRTKARNSTIIRNRATGNGTDYSFNASAIYGPEVNVTGVGDVSAVTNADHPQANLTF